MEITNQYSSGSEERLRFTNGVINPQDAFGSRSITSEGDSVYTTGPWSTTTCGHNVHQALPGPFTALVRKALPKSIPRNLAGKWGQRGSGYTWGQQA